jgi:predicted ATP-dependent endonuclease of OLD family
MFESIYLNNEETKSYKVLEDDKEMKHLSKINIFIGPNNSGKSRFLRSLFSQEIFDYTSQEINLNEINNAINELHSKIETYYRQNNINSVQGVDLDRIKPIPFLSTDKKGVLELIDYIKGLCSIHISSYTPLPGGNRTLHSYITEHLKKMANDCWDKINNLGNYYNEKQNFERIYIPTLRGLRGIDYDHTGILLGKDNYRIRTENDYFTKSDLSNLSIYTGLSLYEDVKKLLLGSSPERNRIREFEKFISKTFFDGKDFTIIPHIADNAVHVKIGEEDDYPIYKLGDGIQSIIILTYPLFFNQDKNMCVFYEEPDLFLHPGFQRVFMEALNLFPNYQYFITTHSNHFLDMTLDFDHISVYTFSKDAKQKFIIDNVKNDNKSILELLGVKNSSVFLSNCTIWVEGITDRIYIREYLKLYQQNKKSKIFLEDIHYSFVEYGGGNITHWSFLDSTDPSHTNINVEKLCGKLFLISDKDGNAFKKDGSKNQKQIRQEKLEENLKERYYCLKGREIENLLSETTLINAIKEIENSNQENLDFKKIKISSYKDKALGKFIKDNVTGISKKFDTDSGTINNKVEFSKIAVSHIKSYEDLSDEARELAEKLYNFIKSNN